MPTNITAGLASVFTALGDKCVKPGGRLALVLPRAILTGIAWHKTRALLGQKYLLEYLICSHDPDQCNFSENTDFSEVLLVAKKRNGETSDDSEQVTCVNLWQQPKTAVEALAVSRPIEQSKAPNLETSSGPLEIRACGKKFGEAFSLPWKVLAQAPAWELPCAFAQAELVKTMLHFQRGEFYTPTEGITADIPLCPLEDFAVLGPDPRDVYDAFDLSKGKTPYPSLWGHDADVVCSMRQRPNQYLAPLVEARPGRHRREASTIWSRSGRIAIAGRIRLNTKRMLAVRLSERVLSDVWWPLVIDGDSQVTIEKMEKALVLWMNSSMALLLQLGCREETEGSWMQFKKPSLQHLPVLDVQGIGNKKLDALAGHYDRLATQQFELIPKLRDDNTRAEVDAALAKVLKLPGVDTLRMLLSREPIVSQTSAELFTNGK